MKRLVRSCLDPIPRSLSTRSLSLLVVMLLSGIAISVHEYLDSRRASERIPRPVWSAPEEFVRDARRLPSALKPSSEASAPDRSGSTGTRITEPRPAPTTSAPSQAPTGWMPETDSGTGVWELPSKSVSDR